jgi:hypothetical protein
MGVPRSVLDVLERDVRRPGAYNACRYLTSGPLGIMSAAVAVQTAPGDGVGL